MVVAKHILRYLKGTIDYGIRYDVNQKVNLHGYVDLNWIGSDLDRKRNSGCCFSMGSGVISWFSRKQSCVALSTAEAEYVAACSSNGPTSLPQISFFNFFKWANFTSFIEPTSLIQ